MKVGNKIKVIIIPRLQAMANPTIPPPEIMAS